MRGQKEIQLGSCAPTEQARSDVSQQILAQSKPEESGAGQLGSAQTLSGPTTKKPFNAQSKRTQEKLVRRAIRGNKKALKVLCESISVNVAFRIMRKLHNTCDAEDIAQEVLVKVCQNIHTLRDPKAFGGWLNTIINNEANRFFVKNKKRGNVISMDEYLESIVIEVENDDELPYEFVLKEDQRRRIIAIADVLPERQQEAIILHYYEGMTLTEVAKAMGITKQAASVHIARAKEKIKESLFAQEHATSRAASSLAALPLGALLSRAFNEEATLLTGFPVVNDAVLSQVGTQGLKHATASSAFAQKLGAGIALAAVVTALVSSIAWVNKQPNVYEPAQGKLTQAVETQGEISFAGGTSVESTHNPSSVVVWATNEHGPLHANSWWITKSEAATINPHVEEAIPNIANRAESPNSAKAATEFVIESISEATTKSTTPTLSGALYHGEGANVGNTFYCMTANKEYGSYTLWFSMEDAAGQTYTLKRDFKIQPNQVTTEKNAKKVAGDEAHE